MSGLPGRNAVCSSASQTLKVLMLDSSRFVGGPMVGPM